MDFVHVTSYEMCERERARAPPPPEPPPHRVRAADLYPRLRTHYDEPGLDIPFVPICGEFVQWVGRTADGGILAMSNYRVHTQPRRRRGSGSSVPLRLVDILEVRDLIHLLILCKDGRTLKCTFSIGDQCLEWFRRISAGLVLASSLQETFAAGYAAWARELPPASAQRALLRPSHLPQRHWFGPEVERLEFTTKGAWRVTAVNSEYKLCSSYPPLLVVPASIGDEDLDSVARFRAMRRVPAVVWRHRGNGAVIARSSQPEVGWLGWRSSEDERLLAAFVSSCAMDRGVQPSSTTKQTKLLIVDARSYTSAVTNRARGGGCECQQYYPAADIQFMCLPNIHHVRRSFQQLRQLAAEPPDQPNWHGNLERTLWLQYISGLGRAAALVVRAVLAGRPVLVHCSDGWDRTPQIVAAAELILDPYYRTCEGFKVLIEREWLDFGHKFADRCGHTFGSEYPNERSPIFLQWLDFVHQIMLQYPCSFEFSQAYLIKLVTHAHSCMFGTFLCNSPKERLEARVNETTAHIWKLLEGPAYRNHLYSPPNGEQVLWPEYNVRSLQFWWSLFVGTRTEQDDDCDVDAPSEPSPPPPLSTHPHNTHAQTKGLKSKTRSCENLLCEVERRTTQRRCSDPNLAPDAINKLTGIVNAESVSSLGRPCRGGVTDSYVDGMAVHHDEQRPAPASTSDDLSDQTDMSASYEESGPAIIDQVDGLHINHFENGGRSRGIASNSSSLERELVSAQVQLNENGNTHSNLALEETPTNKDLSVPDEPNFLHDDYSDVVSTVEAARDARARHISITWRSISESSHQTDSSAGFDITEVISRNHISPNVTLTSNGPSESEHETFPTENLNSTIDDLTNHNVKNVTTTLTNHNRFSEPTMNGVTNGDIMNTRIVSDISAKLLEAELGGGTSSSVSSESETDGEGGINGASCTSSMRKVSRTRMLMSGTARGSQQTLCPGSPNIGQRPTHCSSCCYCCRRASTSGVETSSDSLPGNEQCCCGPGGQGEGLTDMALCVCGGSRRELSARDPLDGLPPARSPVQNRLHQIILHQKMVVEELTGQLRAVRAALRQRVTAPHPDSVLAPTAPSPAPSPAPSAPSPSQAASSGSGSGSELEIGEEARGVIWLPDSAAPRCQDCRNHFWLARRRHHCRKCGGIFCGSCSEVGGYGEWAAVRVCRLCRTHR